MHDAEGGRLELPYITPELRAKLEPFLRDFPQLTIGEVNYVITKLILSRFLPENARYANFNEAIGVLECAKQEFYRRIVAPYEKQKRKDNGDVF